MRPGKPAAFDGNKDFLKVSTCLYKMLQFFILVRSTSSAILGEAAITKFASSHLNDSAAVWCYKFQASNCIPRIWGEFEAAIKAEFVPESHVRASPQQFRIGWQTGSVSTLVDAFWNAILLISSISASKKWEVLRKYSNLTLPLE